MKICIILPRGFPPEIRVEKEARTLLKEGHELHLICIQKEYTQPLEELVQGIHVHRIKKPKRPFGKLSGLLTVEFFLNPIWTSKWENKIKEVIKEHGVDVLNVHDLPVAYTTIRTGKKYGIPIIFEMHENWPAALSAWGKSHIYDRLFMNVTLHKMLEKKCIKDADHILVVVDEQKKRLLKLNIPEKKITVVLNVEDINYFDKFLIDNALVSRYGGKFIISYIGGIGPHRGVDTA
ncbi:MAG: glycosyltransferase, partial [Candidatus Aenigmarchaeota archaeon]|nr:glycosyltransferase [Candidatus Aenigmarchaeota archaeon]